MRKGETQASVIAEFDLADNHPVFVFLKEEGIEVESPLISVALASTRGNQIKAAELLGVNRNTLRKKIRDLDIPVMRGGR